MRHFECMSKRIPCEQKTSRVSYNPSSSCGETEENNMTRIESALGEHLSKQITGLSTVDLLALSRRLSLMEAAILEMVQRRLETNGPLPLAPARRDRNSAQRRFADRILRESAATKAR